MTYLFVLKYHDMINSCTQDPIVANVYVILKMWLIEV